MHTKGQTKSKCFFQTDVSSKKRMNEFYFTTMKPQVVFWKKLKTPKRHFEINWHKQVDFPTINMHPDIQFLKWYLRFSSVMQTFAY